MMDTAVFAENTVMRFSKERRKIDADPQRL
jgi:hypothetical protein